MFFQAIWDKLWGEEARVNDVSGGRTQRTTRGTIVMRGKGGEVASPNNQCPYA